MVTVYGNPIAILMLSSYSCMPYTVQHTSLDCFCVSVPDILGPVQDWDIGIWDYLRLYKWKDLYKTR